MTIDEMITLNKRPEKRNLNEIGIIFLLFRRLPITKSLIREIITVIATKRIIMTQTVMMRKAYNWLGAKLVKFIVDNPEILEKLKLDCISTFSNSACWIVLELKGLLKSKLDTDCEMLVPIVVFKNNQVLTLIESAAANSNDTIKEKNEMRTS